MSNMCVSVEVFLIYERTREPEDQLCKDPRTVSNEAKPEIKFTYADTFKSTKRLCMERMKEVKTKSLPRYKRKTKLRSQELTPDKTTYCHNWMLEMNKNIMFFTFYVGLLLSIPFYQPFLGTTSNS